MGIPMPNDKPENAKRPKPPPAPPIARGQAEALPDVMNAASALPRGYWIEIVSDAGGHSLSLMHKHSPIRPLKQIHMEFERNHPVDFAAAFLSLINEARLREDMKPVQWPEGEVT